MVKVFKPGQRVKIIKPADTRDTSWVPEMDKFHLTTAVIRSRAGSGYRLSGNNWWWHNSCLRPCDENSNQHNDNNKCKWCKDIKLKKKRISAVNKIFNYCPKCGR